MRRRFLKKPPRIKRTILDGRGLRTELIRLAAASKEESNDNDTVPSSYASCSNNECPAIQIGNKPTDQNVISKYHAKRKQMSECWEQIRDDLLQVHIEEMAPATFTCCRCATKTDEIIRCHDCSYLTYYCAECCDAVHTTVLFHVTSIWKGSKFVPYTKRKLPLLERLNHVCNTSYIRQLCVVDLKGVQHKADCRFCTCEEEAITVLRFGLWPATPEKPRVLFHIDIMELGAALQLESGVSTKAFCDGLGFIRRFQIYDVQEVKTIYKVMVGDCSNEYRYHRTMFGKGIHLGLSNSHGCPACTQNTSCICIDANFGLVHKKSSGVGQGLKNVRHADSFFFDQADVDNFVDSYKNSQLSKDCSSFQAGNTLRSKVKNAKLDITGLFGSVCKHDIPLKFCNLRYGERLSYAVYFMGKLQSEDPTNTPIIMYDIACLLHKHLLRNKREDLLSKYSFAVPIFHSYAHNMKCQLQYGQRSVRGTGLADGEGTERLWSYLRTMSKMTKEMSLDNRHDLLVDCLNHYSMKLQLSLAERIVSRYKKAVALRDSALEYFSKAQEDGVIESLDEVKQMYEERIAKCTGISSSDSIDPTDEEEYCWLLLQDSDVRRKLESEGTSSGSEMPLQNELQSIDKKLKKKEKKLHILERWSLLDEGHQIILQSYISKTKKKIWSEMKSLAIERQTLLVSMRKYADGQAIALRIGKQLQLVGTKLGNKLKELNNFLDNPETFSEIASPLSEEYSDLEVSVQKENLKSIDTYTSYTRASEEIVNSSRDMENVVKHFQVQGDNIRSKISDLQMETESRFKQSQIICLLLFKMSNEQVLSKLAKAFSPYIDSFDYDLTVIDHVMQLIKVEEFIPVISEEVLQESLEMIEEFENENKDDDLSSDDEHDC